MSKPMAITFEEQFNQAAALGFTLEQMLRHALDHERLAIIALRDAISRRHNLAPTIKPSEWYRNQVRLDLAWLRQVRDGIERLEASQKEI